MSQADSATPSPQPTLEQLCANWMLIKATESQATAERIAIEDKIVALTGKRDEGAQTVAAGDYKITITGKLSRKMDWQAWESVKTQIPQELHPVKLKPELDEKGVKWLAQHQPDYYRLLPIEAKPAKTAISIKTEIAA